MTDEELKQQYGIHLTSRIQEDAGATEGKWADIEDDEDDWAPETIEWTDGTKTNLNNAEPPQPGPEAKPPPEPKEPLPRVEQPSPLKETARPVPKPTTSIGPNPTVLRLGANAEKQARSASISSKGIHDKLTSSSTAPPPTKSPWAPLPPVEKVSPVVPPVQLQPPSRIPNREPPVSDGPSGPATGRLSPSGFLQPREIAADDFNRAWKDSQGAPRELYNSRSGRYEPVSETRRGLGETNKQFVVRQSYRDRPRESKRGLQSLQQLSRLTGPLAKMVRTGRVDAHPPMLVEEVGVLRAECQLVGLM